MASKQPTLYQSWNNSAPGPSGRGGGRGNTTLKRGRGGRGRGRNSAQFHNSTINLDDDDELCLNALGQMELAESELCRAFSTSNKATELRGFDSTAGQIWIYPTNQPIRDYQFNIVQAALFNNTLVCLPTGLGKTFIAAVVMFNFHRWYPQDIIVFMAPTRPLVTQQLEACHNIVGIHPSKTVEMTGQILPKKRDNLWQEKNVFFLTPQVIQSDIARGSCPVGKVRCIVIDEAHKALGKHSYAEVIAAISKVNPHFRVLALSATPGNDLIAVQQVLKNLLIYRVELRSEKSTDVLPYTHSRNIEKIVVPLDNYSSSVYHQIMEKYQHYTGKLMKQRVLSGRDGSSLTKFRLLQARDAFRKNLQEGTSGQQKGYIEADFATCIALVHSIDLLVVHGLCSFHSYLHGILNRQKSSASVTAELKKNTNFDALLAEIQEKLNISAVNTSFDMTNSGLFSPINESSVENQSDSTDKINYLLSHPKMKILQDIVKKHFASSKNESTRIMIFSHYRDSVQDIGNMLSTLRPLVKPMIFIGQAKNAGVRGRGLKQKEQAQVLQKFKDGGFNVLVATCVGEEGLDIGEVDLIICYDISASPTSSVQRMGRTGRQREGKIIFLLTKDREEKVYYKNLNQAASINKNITDPGKLQSFLYPVTPRMVPIGVEPECFKMNIVLSSEQESNLDHVIEEDDEPVAFDDSDFVRPAKQIKKEKKRVNVKLPSKKKGSSASSTIKSVSKKNEHTLTQCVELMESKKSRSQNKLTSSAIELITLDEDPVDLLAGREGCHDSSFMYVESRVLDEDSVMVDDNYDLLRKLFDVEDLTSQSSVPPCVYIHPPSKKPIQWKLEYNKLLNQSVLLSKLDLLCLKEKVDTNILLGSMEMNCRCGNIKLNENDDLEDIRVRDKFLSDDRDCMDNDTIWEDDRPNTSVNFGSKTTQINNNNTVNNESEQSKANNMTSENNISFDSDETKWDSNEDVPLQIISPLPHLPSPTPLQELNVRQDHVFRPSSVQKFQFKRKTRPSSALLGQENPDSSLSTITNQSSMNASTLSVTTPSPTSVNVQFTSSSRNALSPNNQTSTLSLRTPSPDLNKCLIKTSSSEEASSSERLSLRRKLKTPVKNLMISSVAPFIDDDVDFVKGTSSEEDDDDFQSKPLIKSSDQNNWVSHGKGMLDLKQDCVFSPQLQNFQLKQRQQGSVLHPFRQKSSASRLTSTPSVNTMSKHVLPQSPVTPINYQVTPPRHRSSSPNNSDSSVQIMTPSPDLGLNRRRLNYKRRVISSEETPPYKRVPVKRILHMPRRNPFVLDEADHTSSSHTEMEGDDHPSEEDSFVVYGNDDEEHISNTQQQVMYLQSVNDIIPKKIGRVEAPLAPLEEYSEYWKDLDDDYENDSFCADDVEYADVGVYTQAMNLAREQLDVDMAEAGPSKRVLRSRR